MRALIALCAACMIAGPAAADPCRVERDPGARLACLAHAADSRVLAMAARIDQVLSGLQAATARELRTLGDDYRIAQKNWLESVAGACRRRHPDSALDRAECRFNAARARAGQVDASLRRVARDFGGAGPGPVVPDGFEVLVPLPAPPGGPDARTRLPIQVPPGSE